MKALMLPLFPSALLIFILLFHQVSYASNNINIPAFPEVPSAPDVVSGGAIYFINKDIGSDSFTIEKAKNRSTPWKTIQRGASTLRAGDTLIVSKSKTPYEERVKIDVAGKKDNWVTIKGADGEPPVINGFILEKRTKFIKLSNFHIVPDDVGIYLKRGVKHFVIENTEIDGKGKARWGLQLGRDVIDNNGVKWGYIRNLTVHHTVGYGVYIENGVENIVFDSVVSRNSLKNDGFAGRANPSESSSPNKNIFFINSMAYNNAGDGFDIGADGTQVFEGCISHSNGGYQGTGFKIWGGVKNGGNIWLINNLAYNNAHSALAIKNISDANIYLLHNTFVENETSGGGVEIMTVRYNTGSGGFPMGIPSLYI